MSDVRRKWRTGLWQREKSLLGGAHCCLRVVGRWIHSGWKNSYLKRSSPRERGLDSRMREYMSRVRDGDCWS
jgi:hypothetical protein